MSIRLTIKALFAIGLVIFSTSAIAGLALAAEHKGTASMSDDKALSDKLTLTISGVTAPATGKAYEGWLLSGDFKTPLSVGVIKVAADGSVSHTYTSVTKENLIGKYSTFAISVEPSPDTDPAPSGTYAYTSTIPTAGMTHVRHIVSEWAAAPGKVGFAEGARKQLAVAQAHAALSLARVAASDLAGAQTHAQHVVNILEGSKGTNFNEAAGNPGDGFGVLVYGALAVQHAGFAATAAPTYAPITSGATMVKDSMGNVIDWGGKARDQALLATKSSSLTDIQLWMNNVANLLKLAQDGVDADADGVVAGVKGEGGAQVAYWQGQLMATYEVMAGAPKFPVVGDTSVPMVFMGALMAGAALVVLGGTLLLWSRTRRA